MATTHRARAAPGHDPEACATCTGFVPWTPDRRRLAELYAERARRRICDLPEDPELDLLLSAVSW
jgi:hypothetical protein